jgi:hypothetical protein
MRLRTPSAEPQREAPVQTRLVSLAEVKVKRELA